MSSQYLNNLVSFQPLLFKNLIWMTSKEAAEYLRTSPNNIRVMVYRGVIRPYKLNGRNRFKREELDNLVESSICKGEKL